MWGEWGSGRRILSWILAGTLCPPVSCKSDSQTGISCTQRSKMLRISLAVQPQNMQPATYPIGSGTKEQLSLGAFSSCGTDYPELLRPINLQIYWVEVQRCVSVHVCFTQHNISLLKKYCNNLCGYLRYPRFFTNWTILLTYSTAQDRVTHFVPRS